MSSEYIKQLEEANETLRSRLEHFESRCEWLEKLRISRSSDGGYWSGSNVYTIGVNDYKTPHIDAFVPPSYMFPDKNAAEVANYIRKEVVDTYVFSTSSNNTNKYIIRQHYDLWCQSITSFTMYAKIVFDDEHYADIHKISLSTFIHLAYAKTSAFDLSKLGEPDNDKYLKNIYQGVTVDIKRGEKFPIVRVTLKKTINQMSNNINFKDFGKKVRKLKNIYQAVEDYNKSVQECEESLRKTRNGQTP